MKHNLYKIKGYLESSWEYVVADNQRDAIENYCDHYSLSDVDRTRFSVEFISTIITPKPYSYK